MSAPFRCLRDEEQMLAGKRVLAETSIRASNTACYSTDIALKRVMKLEGVRASRLSRPRIRAGDKTFPPAMAQGHLPRQERPSYRS